MTITFLFYALLYFLVGGFLLHLYKFAIKSYENNTISALGWFLWPDVDIKFRGGEEFVEKYTSDKFYGHIILFGPFRLMHIFAIHLGCILGFMLISFTVIFLLCLDFVHKKLFY